MNKNITWLWGAAALFAAILAAYLLWTRPPAPPVPASVAVPVPVPVALAPASVPAPAAAASVPEPLPDPNDKLPALAAADPVVSEALVGLLGRATVLQQLQSTRFLQNTAATVDNLGRDHAAARLWPVMPTPGRFDVDDKGRVTAANAARYTPFVKMVESVDPARAAALYRRFLPLLQQSYEGLGYPGKRFHARLLAVIDQLLATPQSTVPLAVWLVEVKGPVPSTRPWVRYEFVDPQLEALSSGQKILLRTGAAHQQTLMDWLRRFRVATAR